MVATSRRHGNAKTRAPLLSHTTPTGSFPACHACQLSQPAAETHANSNLNKAANEASPAYKQTADPHEISFEQLPACLPLTRS
ncbi:hypothetical protein GGTG_13554 [Gaeumannomyces tritici R3-111a-1]|uniref:Uncharacterized protein n=1 Tax=Gaeumannomyces tritici (strain R3-111a-1) TaxID=644352 RepID=J3PJ72_GAET3|nr:hypothetical protein GGTG_13554 [Gaeumannomyces tritici R3-111a-1]EJT68890.1 hypothetical protein GGTG_13554 [Gaeumannomyces tritici R3-111a-1]